MCSFVTLAIFSLFLPPVMPMGMPRIALSLLAIVSIATMMNTVVGATPPDATSLKIGVQDVHRAVIVLVDPRMVSAALT